MIFEVRPRMVAIFLRDVKVNCTPVRTTVILVGPGLILLVAFGLSMVLCCLAAGRTFGLLDVDPAHLW